MSAINDSFLDLERHRLQLEKTVADLEKVLNHWRKWDAEYEALREEISPLVPSKTFSSSVDSRETSRENVSSSSLERVRREYKSDLINDKEKDEIFGSSQKAVKTPQQVSNILERRQDYVGKNITALETQLTEARRKLELATILSDPGMENEDGLPFEQITEELDADGNVVSCELLRLGEKHKLLEEALDKVGNGRQDSDRGQDLRVASDSPATTVPSKRPMDVEEISDSPHSSHGIARPPHAALLSNSPQEGSFKDHVERPFDHTSYQQSHSGLNSNSWDIVDSTGRVAGDTQITPDDNESYGLAKDFRDAAGSLDENLAYNPDQIGADTKEIVAIFQDLNDDDLSDYESMNDNDDDDDDNDDDDDDDWEDYDDEEDKYGRSTKRIITREYEERVMAIKKRLGLDWQVSRPSADHAVDDDEESGDEDMKLGRITVNHKSSASSSFSSASREPPKKGILKSTPGASPTLRPKKKKSVRFSEEVDIAPNPGKPSRPAPAMKEDPAPIRDEVVVRDRPPMPKETSQPPKKASRFRQHLRQENAKLRGIPGPAAKAHTVMSDITVRHDVPAPNVDTEHVADMAAIAEEYHDKRRRMIQRYGGFVGDDESPIQPVEKDGTPKRVSRFKSGSSKFKAACLAELEENN